MKNLFKAYMAFATILARQTGVRYFNEITVPEPTLYAMNEQLAQLSAEIQQESNAIAGMCGDPTSDLKVVEQKQERLAGLQKRFNILKGTRDSKEARERASAVAGALHPTAAGDYNTPQDRAKAKKRARGEFYVAALRGGDVAEVVGKYMNLLGVIDDGASGGDNLLPSLLGDELIHEPFEQDGFLTECSHTRITGLELPRIGYTIADDGDVKDTEEGKEMAVRGDKVGFGRHKTLIYADVSESVLQGSAFDVESYVDQALDAGMRKKAKRRIFATTPKSGEEHMSVYDETTVGVKTIEYDPVSDTLIEAVITALADLGDEYADKAKVAMRRVDYYKAIKELAMGADTLWGAKPEDVIGAPVVFCENASYPIVGDLSTIHINDDMPPFYDTDKDTKKGVRTFGLTRWDDIQIKLASALRKVKPKTENPSA